MRKKPERPEGFDSFEELYFSWYVSELEKAGIIHLAKYHPETMVIYGEVHTSWRLAKKTKYVVRPKTLLNALEYTPDWIIYWNPIAVGKFVYYIGNKEDSYQKNPFTEFPFFCYKDKEGRYYSYIDVKGAYSSFGNKSKVIFSIIQRVLFSAFDEYVQAINPYDLFKKTFCPANFKFTPKTKKERSKAIGTIPFAEYFAKFDIPIQTTLSFKNEEDA